MALLSKKIAHLFCHFSPRPGGIVVKNEVVNSREAASRDAKRIRGYYSFFFSGSTFGKSCLFSLNVPVKALMNALRKTLKIVVMTAAFGLSKLPLKGTLVPNRSLG